jgi:hypothetical protein
MPAHISYVQFKQHSCACHTCTECEPECSRLCVCSTASAGRYCYVLRNSWLLTTVRKMQRVGEQLQSHTRTTYNYTFTIYTLLHPHLEQPYTHISTQTSTQTSTHQHTSVHIIILLVHIWNSLTHTQTSTHQNTSVHIIILLVHIWNSLTHTQISTHQYTSLSYQDTNQHTSAHISTRTHIHARKTHTTSFPPTDIHPLNTHTYTSTYTSPQTQ